MKNNKKGFTLIELLAVVAILAILVVMAVPAVLNTFNDARQKSFITQAQSLYKTAEQAYVLDQLSANGPTTRYCKVLDGESTNVLDLKSSGNVSYNIVFDAEGNITTFEVSDSNYSIKQTKAAVTLEDLATVDAERSSVASCIE